MATGGSPASADGTLGRFLHACCAQDLWNRGNHSAEKAFSLRFIIKSPGRREVTEQPSGCPDVLAGLLCALAIM